MDLAVYQKYTTYPTHVVNNVWPSDLEDAGKFHML